MREYFSRLYGNLKTKSRLSKAIEDGTTPHAFLIIGASGSGKKTLATELAAALNCERRGDKSAPLPCCACNTCRRIYGGNFVDIKRLRRQDKKATIGVEEVRDFREDMFLSATESVYKIYIIEEAEKLTPNAQNALLKVLEEPPSNVIIILLAESSDKILTTIKSRAQSISMERFDKDGLKKYLAKEPRWTQLAARNSEAVTDGIIMSADGRIGRVLELLTDKAASENTDDRELAIRIVNALSYSVPYSELYAAVSALPTSKLAFTEAIETVMCAVRDITVIKFAGNTDLLFYTSTASAKDAAREITTKRLLSIYEILKSALEDIEKNVSSAMIKSNLSAKIRLI